MGNTAAARKLKEALVGPVVAMTTTFNEDYSLDLEGMKALTDLFIDGGIKNVIVAGSTGEFYSMSDEERMQVIETVVKHAAGRMTVFGCAAHSGTQLAIDLTKQCKDVGCDGPTLYRHNEGVNLAFYDGHVEYRKKEKVWSQEAWDAGNPGMWSTFRNWPPTDAEQTRLPRP